MCLTNKATSTGRETRHRKEKGKGMDGPGRTALCGPEHWADYPYFYSEELISSLKKLGATECQATGGTGTGGIGSAEEHRVPGWGAQGRGSGVWGGWVQASALQRVLSPAQSDGWKDRKRKWLASRQGTQIFPTPLSRSCIRT